MIIRQLINQNNINRELGKYQQSNGTTSDPATITDDFNNYFVNIGPILASNIPDQGLEYRSYMPSGNEFSMFLTPASRPEVEKLMII